MGFFRMQEKETDLKQLEIDRAWQAHLTEPENGAKVRRKWLLFYFEHQDQKCAYCHVPLLLGKAPRLEDRQATIDHIFPRSLGGEDEPSNTLAACAFCNALKGSSALSDFLLAPELINRILQTSECPPRLSSDPSSIYYDSESIARGLSVTVDQREFRNVYEYCVPENWVRLKLERTKARNGQPMTVVKTGNVSVIYLDTKRRIHAIGDGKKYLDSFDRFLLERPQPS
jgi:5-methylcytosine-specific restriction endonuclease McrA